MQTPRTVNLILNLLSMMRQCVSPPWDFAPWLHLVTKLVSGCPSPMQHLGQLSSLRLLEHKRKSLASKLNPPWYFAPWLHLVSKLLANGCPSKFLTPGQVLISYAFKPLRKDLTFLIRTMHSLIIFRGQSCAFMIFEQFVILAEFFLKWSPYIHDRLKIKALRSTC